MSMHDWRIIATVLLGIFSTTRLVAEDRTVVNGLKSEIFAGQNFDRLVAERVDPNIDWFWDWGAPHTDAPVDNFSVRWSGWIRAPKAGRYKMLVHSNDGTRLWINGQRIINEWRPAVEVYEASVELSEDPLSIQLEMFEASATTWSVLMWQPTGVASPAVVPTECLFPDEESARAKPAAGGGSDKRGLVAEYFDKRFARKLRTDRVHRTEAIWGAGGPGWGLPADVGARYTGVLVPPVTGQYKLIGWANEQMAVWIDGKPVLDATHRRKKSDTAFIELEAGTPYPLRIDFLKGAKWGSYYLHWTPPGESKELSIPPECLFQTKAAALKP